MAEHEDIDLPDAENETQEIADGVDASATADNARYHSGVLGYETDMLYSQPRNVTVAASGTASTAFTGDGLRLDSGATAGDEAFLDSPNTVFMDELGVHRLTYAWVMPGGAPTTDEVRLGIINNANPPTAGAYLDFSTGEFFSSNGGGADQSQASTILSDQGVLEIEWVRNHRVTFRLGWKDNFEEVTFGDPGNNVMQKLAQNVSAGGGDVLQIKYMRHEMYPYTETYTEDLP